MDQSAVDKNDVDDLRNLISQGYSVNQLYSGSSRIETLLFYADYKEKQACIDFLMKIGADSSIINNELKTVRDYSSSISIFEFQNYPKFIESPLNFFIQIETEKE
jgi:hypothetical protein